MPAVEPESEETELPNEFLDAWATVLIDLHERMERGKLPTASQTTESVPANNESHIGPGVATGHGTTSGDLTSPDQEARP